MQKATTINAATRKSKITCHNCSLSYSARDYGLLYDSKKLAYFKYKPVNYKRQRVMCHDCFYKKTIESMGERDKLEVEIITGENEIIVTFYKK
jgi:hypothetical protein